VADMYAFVPRTQEPRILDCGANIGMAVLYFKTLYPRAQIIAIEADPVTFGMLQRNIQRNGWRDVSSLNLAVSGVRGKVTLYTDERAGGLSHSIRKTDFVGTAECQVEARPLSEFADQQVDLLKMDIEGAEDDVIAELESTGTLSRIDQLIAEYHLHLDPREDRLGVFLSRLETAGMGYQIRADLALPFRAQLFQCLILYAYRKSAC
jgi:FkbM family methyltransferase